MSDNFIIPVLYQGKELDFEASVVRLGYIQKIRVDVNGVIVFFEADEERNYRAVIEEGQAVMKDIDVPLLQVIAETLQQAAR